jgi:hypothetical protein
MPSRPRLPQSARRAMPSAWGVGMTRHPKLGAVERRLALWVNFLTSRRLQGGTPAPQPCQLRNDS